MENSRRTLRNKSNCHQINNLFNIKTAYSSITTHLPPSLLTKIGKLQKISCANIHDLPELHPHHHFQLQLQKCRLAKYQQSLSLKQLSQSSQIRAEQAMVSQQPNQLLLKQALITNSVISCQSQGEKDWSNVWIEQQPKFDIWKDAEFLDKLNDLVVFGYQGSRIMDEELFEK